MDIIKKTKNKCPLIHCITNYVTINDVANVILACGGSPIMADEFLEVEDIEAISDGLLINIGTLNQRVVESMILAGKKANKLGHVIVFDPVGVGASNYRNDVAKRLLDEIHFDVIKGNISEIKALTGLMSKTSGVDANKADKVTNENLEDVVFFAKNIALKFNSIITITGEIDIITDGINAYTCYNGCFKMGDITGTGCMSGGVIASYVCANKDNKLEAVCSAIASMGICGEISLEKCSGNGSFRTCLIDAISLLDDNALKRGIKIEKY